MRYENVIFQWYYWKRKKKEKISSVYFVFVSSKPKDEMSKLSMFSKAIPTKKVHGILKSPDATPERRSPGSNSRDYHCFQWIK